MRKEIWKDVAGFEGFYQISSFGRVKSLLYNRQKVLKGASNSMGYKQVVFVTSDASKKHRFLVHRLVAQAFLPNSCDFLVVNHLDGNNQNNHVENLEWCSYSHNALHAVSFGKIKTGSQHYAATIDESMVTKIVVLSMTHSSKEIAHITGVSYGIIYKILQGAAWNYLTGLPRKRYYKLKTAS